MKRKHNEGFSLIDVLVGITLLALVVIPISSGLIMSSRMNAKAEQLLQDQLAVSSAVEIMMAEGLAQGLSESKNYTLNVTTTDGVTTRTLGEITVEDSDLLVLKVKPNGTIGYDVTVRKGEVSVDTFVKIGGIDS